MACHFDRLFSHDDRVHFQLWSLRVVSIDILKMGNTLYFSYIRPLKTTIYITLQARRQTSPCFDFAKFS